MKGLSSAWLILAILLAGLWQPAEADQKQSSQAGLYWVLSAGELRAFSRQGMALYPLPEDHIPLSLWLDPSGNPWVLAQTPKQSTASAPKPDKLADPFQVQAAPPAQTPSLWQWRYERWQAVALPLAALTPLYRAFHFLPPRAPRIAGLSFVAGKVQPIPEHFRAVTGPEGLWVNTSLSAQPIRLLAPDGSLRRSLGPASSGLLPAHRDAAGHLWASRAGVWTEFGTGAPRKHGALGDLLMQDRWGHLWFGRETQGHFQVSVYRRGRWHRLDLPIKVPSYRAFGNAWRTDAQGRLWLVLSEVYAHRFDPERREHFTIDFNQHQGPGPKEYEFSFLGSDPAGRSYFSHEGYDHGCMCTIGPYQDVWQDSDFRAGILNFNGYVSSAYLPWTFSPPF